jgi:D-alanine-D-alanine ligase
MKVALLHNARPVSIAEGLPDDAFEEFDSAETIAAVAAALRLLPISLDLLEADRTLPGRLEAGGYDFVFNIAEGRGRRCREGIPAAICELLSIPFTGSDMLTLAIALDKAAARRLVSPEVPVARAVLVESSPSEAALAGLHYPVMVKPNDEGSSKGLGGQPVVASAADALDRVCWLRETYRCPVLVEEFLPGAEVTVGVVGNHAETRIVGMMEIASTEEGPAWTYSLDVKRDWHRRVRYHLPPRLDAFAVRTIERYALTAYRLLGCRDLARLDFRLNAAGTPHFLECNPLPGLHPESSDMAILSRGSLPYESLVQGVFLDAARRWNISLPLKGHACK